MLKRIKSERWDSAAKRPERNKLAWNRPNEEPFSWREIRRVEIGFENK